MAAYTAASKADVRGLRRARRPVVEGLSIDEAFLDVRGMERIAGTPARDRRCGCARAVREQVGLPITVGVARTKFLAKVASAVAKPDGLLVVPADGELAFLHPLPVERLWGVGPVTAAKLHARGLTHRRRGRARWRRRRSSRCSGARLGPAPARARAQPRSAARAGRAPAALDRLAARARARAPDAGGELDAILVGARRPRHPPHARRRGRVGRTVVLRLRFGDFTRATRSHTLPGATAADAADPGDCARAAGRGAAADRARRASRCVGISVTNLEDGAPCSSRCRSTAPTPARSTRRSTACASASARRRSRAACCSAATRAPTMPLLPD